MAFGAIFGMTSCADSEESGPGAGDSCTANICNGNTVMSCIGGHLAVGETCPNGCVNGACSQNPVVGACTSGDKSCSAAGIPQTCVGGQWIPLAACIAGQTCVSGVCQNGSGACTAGATKCESNAEFTCVSGSWSQTKACPSGCNGNVCAQEQTTCTAGATKCEGNVEFSCSGNAWNQTKVCSNGCNGNVCAADTGSCTNGSVKCENNSLYLCTAGNWISTQDCINGCADATSCAAQDCTGTDTKCENNTVYSCVSGAWSNPITCTNGCDGAVCKKSETDACAIGETKCDADIAYNCTAGQWTEAEKCPNGCDGKVCKAADETKCTPNDTKCELSSVYTCSAIGTWSKTQICTYGCDGNACKAGEELKCKKNETAINGLCVPTDMLNAKEGTDCQEAWMSVEYCDASGNAVFCDYEDMVKTVEKCEAGCAIADLSKEEEGWLSAVCKNSFSSLCKDDKTTYTRCFTEYDEEEEEDYAYTLGIVCYPTIDGKFIGINPYVYDLDAEFSVYTGECSSGECNAAGSACKAVCSSDKDCQNADEGNYCSKEWDMCYDCKSDADCTEDAPKCFTMEGIGFCTECAQNSDCASNRCFFGYCDDPEACTKDSDCLEGEECINKICTIKSEPECTKDSDCGAKQICQNQSCVAVECKVASDCASGKTCNTSTHKCETTPVTDECANDSDCGAKQICQNKSCVAVECKVASDCASGKTCNTSTHKCEATSGDATTYSTDFSFVTGTDTSYAPKTPYTYTDATYNFTITAYGRANMDAYSIDGQGIILATNKNANSKIEVSGLTKGVGTVTMDVKGWDKSDIVVSYGSKTTDKQSVSKSENKTLTFPINDASVTSFTITSSQRAAIDNLKWTSAK